MKLLFIVAVVCFSFSVFANDYDANGRPWFEKYFESGEVEKITGLKRPKNWYQDPSIEFIDLEPKWDLPDSYDLRKEHPSGTLQPTRNQKSCGSCWAFSVVAAVESAYAMLNPLEDFIDLSEQELVSNCSGTGGSCSGGYFRALSYIKKPGLPTEEDHPYLAKNSYCKNNVTKIPRIKSWKYIGNRVAGSYRKPSTQALKTAIYEYQQEISVTVAAFSFSSSGIYTSCKYASINHMVNISGWHDFETQEEVNKYKSDGYWIMRNSWGTSFGDGGYAKVLYTDRYGRKCNNLGETGAVATLPVDQM